MVKTIMIQGTASGVGKTILTLALCRLFKQDGYTVAPFKSQNMTTNTAITETGEEIAVSQILQAHAAGVTPKAAMNPVIIKPGGKQGSQVVLGGKPYDTVNAYNFRSIRKTLLPEIMRAYEELSAHYDIIVIEGAGSPVELNLNQDDIVNMGIAKQTHSPVLLVADIDRGGVFASLYGTLKLLHEEERKFVKATIINRFKGDMEHFAEGTAILEDITRLPVAGIVPYVKFELPEEDSLFGGETTYVPGGSFEEQFDLIADTVRKSLKMDLIYEILNGGS